MTIAKAIARAWSDPAYKSRLLNEPYVALAEVGVDIPSETSVQVVEDSNATRHLVLPVKPSNAGELSQGELERIAGGVVIQSVTTY
ncbi:MAG: NHLP leader peptide family RiPP precursor [Pseudomonadota bacterium]